MSVADMLKRISTDRTSPSSVKTDKVETIETVYGKQPEIADPKRIIELWQRFARSIEQNDTHLYTLMQRLPRVEGNIICATVNSKLQESKLLESLELIDFIRMETGVKSLSIRVEVEEVEETSEVSDVKIAYTSKEKLAMLIEKNPDIDDLVKEFSLDVDF